MTQYAATQGTFADFKLIKGRKVAQLIIEVPVEQCDDALKALGGIPQPHETRWVAVARMNMADAPTREDGDEIGTSTSEHNSLTSAAKLKRELTLPQRVAMMCGDEDFQQFLSDKFGDEYSVTYNPEWTDNETAAAIVKFYCGVKSRSEILPGTPAADKWRDLYYEFEAWSDAR